MFAWKPAPVQVTWLGYFATTGVAAIDYLLADALTLTRSEERNFTEKVWRLPETRLCFARPEEEVDAGPLPARTSGRVTFGCFNRLEKINDDVVATWAKLLARVPDSRLLLKSVQFADSAIRRETLARFATQGVVADRISLEPSERFADYLAAHRRIDIALDPFPYTGGATTMHALWMGVPVLTLAGQRFIARQGVGLLQNAGLGDWIAGSVDDYVAAGAAYAANLDALASLRSTMRERLQASPILDTRRFAGHFEAAMRGMWREWCGRHA